MKPSDLRLLITPAVLASMFAQWRMGYHVCSDTALLAVMFALHWGIDACGVAQRILRERDVQNHADDCECCEAVPVEA